MRTTILHGVTNALRTPLAAVLGFALTLARADLDLSVDESRDIAVRIAVNARKLDRLLTDLLDLDRLDRGIMEPARHPTDLGALVRRVVRDSELAAQRDIDIRAHSVELSLDPAKVERIVENLLANAVRHTPSGTRVWVRVEPVGGGGLLTVEDDGPGVPEELRTEVFEPFRRGPDAPSHAPGVGVGLSLVARFAALHGGRAWVEGREGGGGASFRVFLSASPSPTSAIPAQVASASRPAAPASSASSRALRANPAGSSPHPFQPSATDPASRTTSSAWAPTHTGGPPGEAGGGRSGPATGGTWSPPSHGSLRSRAFTAATVSARWARRSGFDSVGMPKARCSGSSMGSPVPIPRIMRPPVSSSIPAAILAIRPAGRSWARATRVPTRTRSVTAPTAASVVKPSSEGRSGAAPGGKKWSNANRPA